MDDTSIAEINAGLAVKAAAQAMEIALGVQMVNLNIVVAKLVQTGALTHDHAAEISDAVASIVGADLDVAEGTIAQPVFDVLSRHAARLRDQAAKASLAGAPVGVKQ